MRRWSVILGLCALGCAACSAGGGSPEFEVERRGATVIARNGPPAGGDTLAPLVTIGREAGVAEAAPDEFGRITSVTLDRRGDVYVADGQSLDVRVFSRRGEHVRTFGRAGQGPGEFRALYSLAFVGDTLLALDARNARINVFSREGEAIGTWPWLPLSGPVNHVRFYPTSAHEVWVLWLRHQSAGSVHRRLTARGAADTMVHAVPQGLPRTMLACARPDSAISFFGVPFAGRRIIAPAPGAQLAAAWSADYRIAVAEANGDTTRIVERTHEPLRITAAQWDSASAEFREFRREWPGARCDPPELERPPHRAALHGVYFDDDGHMIVEVEAGSHVRYDFFNADGRAVQTVYTPMRDREVAPAFRGRFIVQVAKDSLDVQYVQVFQRSPW